MDTARTGARTVGQVPGAAWALAVAALLVADVAMGRSYLGVNLPGLAAGGAVALAVGLAARRLLPALLGATAASVAVSYLAVRFRATDAFAGEVWPGMAELAGLGLLLGWALRSLPKLRALLASAAVAAALMAIVERSPTSYYRDLLLLGMALTMGVAAGVGLYLRWIDHDRRRGVEQARQGERLAIARELHDVVAHHVTGIVVQAQAAQAVWEARPAAALDALVQIEAAGSEALGSMRRLVGSLRADEVEPRAPTATLDELHALAANSASLGLPVRLHLDGVPADLPAELGASVHRIVREALTNARRHATGATAVDVRVAAGAGTLTLEVSDDGRAGVRSGSGYGITGMAERAEALGGRFRAGPRQGDGWLVRAELPLERR